MRGLFRRLDHRLPGTRNGELAVLGPSGLFHAL